jgi:hypothetical protein
MSEDTKTKAKTKLRRQAELLWRLVTTTPGVADLADPMKRAEFHFERLTQRQKVTVAVIAKQLAEGFHAIEEEISRQSQEETSEAITPDEVIPPGETREEG